MIEAVVVALCVLGLSTGCGRRKCREGTVLLDVRLSGSADQANSLDIEMQIDGGAVRKQSLSRDSAGTRGTIEIEFTAGYPKGSTLDVVVRAVLLGNEVGVGSASVALAGSCESVQIEIGGDVDLAGLDLSGVDLTQTQAAPGQACDENTTCLNGSQCVDGVCCTSACTGQCEACNVPGSLGVCSPILGAPANGRPACTGAGDPTCGGTCDGVQRTTCAYPTTSCRTASCTNGVATAAASCSAGTCPAPTETICASVNKLCGVSDCTTVVSMAAGYETTCAVLADTTVRCWGGNFSGQLALGDADTTDRNVATRSPLLLNVTKVTADQTDTNRHFCALLNNQTVECWGANFEGQLGIGVMDNLTHGDPQPLLASAGTTQTGIVDVAAGNVATCFVTAAGAVRCIGATDFGVPGAAISANGNVFYPIDKAGATTGFTEVVVGASSACAINGSDNTSSAYCWGSNGVGQLGSAAGNTATPTLVGTLDNLIDGDGNPPTVTTIGRDIACAITNTSTLNCWGRNTNGMLGRNMAVGGSSSTPMPVCIDAACSGSGSAFNLTQAVCAGYDHVCALRGNAGARTLYCWGDDGHEQHGDGVGQSADAILAKPVTLPSTPVGLTCGAYHTCVNAVNGKVYCWGWNSNGQVGNGAFGGVGGDVALPTEVVWP